SARPEVEAPSAGTGEDLWLEVGFGLVPEKLRQPGRRALALLRRSAARKGASDAPGMGEKLTEAEALLAALTTWQDALPPNRDEGDGIDELAASLRWLVRVFTQAAAAMQELRIASASPLAARARRAADAVPRAAERAKALAEAARALAMM